MPTSAKSVYTPADDGSDAQLIERWAAGDTIAGRALLNRYMPTVRSFFRNRAAEDSEDLVQQTFLCCVEARERFRGDASVRTFILAIARNQLYRHYRNATRRRRVGLLLPDLDEVPSPIEAILCQQDERALHDALRSVPLEMQAALELAYWEELPAPEIALRLQIPLGTVYSRLRRARELLNQRLRTGDD